MVITKRYNSVERFTSMELSANGAGGGGGGGMDGATRPTSQLAFPPQQAWPNQPPVTLARRRSNEHLIQQQGPASPTGSSPHPPSIIAAHPGAMAQQQRGTPSPFHFQQQQQNVPQQPQEQQQFGQQRPQAQPRSIMRPPSSQASGPYGGGPYGMAPQAQNRQYPFQYATGPGHQQYQQQKAFPPQQHSPRSQSQLPPQHLSDVFQSREDVELAENMRSFFASKVPAPIWLTLSVVQIIAGIVSLFYGALNASPYNCRVEPNIPIFLIISGILLIVNGGIRLFFFLTSSSNAKRKVMRRAPGGNLVSQQQRKKGTPMKHLCEYALEGTVLFAIVVVVILGCVWVYGAQRFMHNQNYMFENHYCHYTLYWTAWWSVTLHLGFFALLILGAIILLIYGALLG